MPSPRSRRTSLNAFEILFRLPGGRPGPGLVLFAKRPFASRFASPRSVSFLAADGVWSALVRILSRSLSTACWAFVGTLGACAFRPSVLLEITPAGAPPVDGDSPKVHCLSQSGASAVAKRVLEHRPRSPFEGMTTSVH